MIAAGYIDGKPTTCYYNEAQTKGPKVACGYGLVSSDRTIVDNYKKRLQSMECTDLAEIVREAILLYAKDTKVVSIGAPVYIRVIFQDSSQWYDSVPAKRKWNNMHEFATAYWNGDVILNLLPGATKIELDSVIRLGEIWSKNGSKN